MKSVRDPAQTVQRVKVGMIGLAMVILLIVLANVIIRSVGHNDIVVTAGAVQPDVVANLALANSSKADTGEPLAELGAAPSANSQAAH